MDLPAGFVPDALPQGFTPDAPAAPVAAPAPEAPGGFESVGRGLLQGATLGFSDEIGGAIGSLFSDKSYSQVRDEIRANDNAAKEAHPFLYGAGEVGGGIASTLIPGLGAAKAGAGLARTALTLGGQGALAGLGGSEATDVGGMAKDAAIGGVLGAGIGAAAHGAGKLLAGAPAKAIEDRAANVVQGEGIGGAASAASKKALAKDTEGVDKALTESFKVAGEKKPLTLASIMRDPAKEVLPVVDERLSQIGKRLDPIYTKFDKAEGGGMSIHHIVNSVDDEIAQLGRQPGNEQMIKALEQARDSAVKSWAPEIAEKIASNRKTVAMGFDSVFKNMDDVKVPFGDVRDWVSRLQKKAVPLEETTIKTNVAMKMRDLLNNTIEAAADNHPKLAKDAEKLFEANSMFSNTARIRDAVEERLVKENSGTTSAKGHLASAIGAAVGGVAGGAIPVPIVGHAIGAAVGASVAGKVQGGLGGARQAATAQLAAASQRLAQLAQRAHSGDANAMAILHAVRNSPDVLARMAALHATANSPEDGQ